MDHQAEATGPVRNGTRQVRSIAGQEIVFDAEGFMLDPSQWTEEVAHDLASESGITLLESTHWRVIRFIRDYYLQNGRVPLHRELKKGIGMSLLEIESLFSGGIRHGARRLAGLPNPRSCGM
ncbi:MAG: TusE/DsrC/DsvC family sulfur relay protein [Thermodesulfobacteriota bacterium]